MGQEEIRRRLSRPVEGATLGLFRLLFGLCMSYKMFADLYQGRVAAFFRATHFNFSYEWLPFLRPVALEAVMAVAGLCALGLALGWRHRAFAWGFFLSYTYLFLLDKTRYNNHFYLISLLALLFACSHAARWGAVATSRRATLPCWQLYIFRFQILLVYVYGGLAKLNSDWLQGQPLEIWLDGRRHLAYAMSYGGLILDLLLAPLVLYRPLRPVILTLFVLFHLCNWYFFEIGIFPLLMLASTVVFLEPEAPRRWFGRSTAPESDADPPLSRWALTLLSVYVAVQVLVPLRHHLYPGDASWTGEGHRFAWRMKLRQKVPRIGIIVKEPGSGRSFRLDPRDHLNSRQIEWMASRPDMLAQYARHLRRFLTDQGFEGAQIYIRSAVSLNGRPPQELIDPDYDLGSAPILWLRPAPYIVPLEQPRLERTPPDWLKPALALLNLALVMAWIWKESSSRPFSAGLGVALMLWWLSSTAATWVALPVLAALRFVRGGARRPLWAWLNFCQFVLLALLYPFNS